MVQKLRRSMKSSSLLEDKFIAQSDHLPNIFEGLYKIRAFRFFYLAEKLNQKYLDIKKTAKLFQEEFKLHI